jgi:hypothetical protein
MSDACSVSECVLCVYVWGGGGGVVVDGDGCLVDGVVWWTVVDVMMPGV